VTPFSCDEKVLALAPLRQNTIQIEDGDISARLGNVVNTPGNEWSALLRQILEPDKKNLQ